MTCIGWKILLRGVNPVDCVPSMESTFTGVVKMTNGTHTVIKDYGDPCSRPEWVHHCSMAWPIAPFLIIAVMILLIVRTVLQMRNMVGQDPAGTIRKLSPKGYLIKRGEVIEGKTSWIAIVLFTICLKPTLSCIPLVCDKFCTAIIHEGNSLCFEKGTALIEGLFSDLEFIHLYDTPTITYKDKMDMRCYGSLPEPDTCARMEASGGYRMDNSYSALYVTRGGVMWALSYLIVKAHSHTWSNNGKKTRTVNPRG